MVRLTVPLIAHPSPSFLLVANPASGRGRGEVVAQRVEQVLRERGCRVRVVRTAESGDAVEFAAETTGADATVVVAIGGDGTVHEVLNGLMTVERARRPCLGVVPAGTGNDYAQELGVPLRDPEAAARALVNGLKRRVDVGRLEGTEHGGRFFGVGIGFAMMSAALAEMRRSRPLPGRLSYFLGGIVALLTFEAPELAVTVDEGTQRERFMVVHVGLCHTTGGGICLTPDAGLDTGRLHVSTVTKSSKLKGLLQWPWISRGRQLQNVRVLTGERVRVEGESGLLIHVDGELLRVPGGAIEATVLPRELEVLSGRWDPPLPRSSDRSGTGTATA